MPCSQAAQGTTKGIARMCACSALPVTEADAGGIVAWVFNNTPAQTPLCNGEGVAEPVLMHCLLIEGISIKHCAKACVDGE